MPQRAASQGRWWKEAEHRGRAQLGTTLSIMVARETIETSIYIHYLDMLTTSMQPSRFSPYFLRGPFLEGHLNQGHTDKCTKRIQG